MKDSKAEAIKIIGVGQGASRIVDRMYRKGIPGVSFLACDVNFDSSGLLEAPRYRLGRSVTIGIGSPGSPDKGKKAAEDSLDDIKKLLADGAQTVIVISCMGGGTGTGAAPVIAKTAMKMGLFVVGVITVPFRFEELERSLWAIRGANSINGCVHFLSVLNNQLINSVYPDYSATELFNEVDNVLVNAVESLVGIIADSQPATDPAAILTDRFDIKDFIDY